MAKSDLRIERLALIVAATERAHEAAAQVRASGVPVVELAEADAVLVLGGDGTMLDAMHRLIDARVSLPIYGLTAQDCSPAVSPMNTTGQVLVPDPPAM